MTVLELHIAVRQRLNKIGIFKNESFFPEEIDIALMKAEDRIIKEVFKKGVEDTEVMSSWLAPIEVKNKVLTYAVSATSEPDYEPNSVYGYLPSNFYLLLNDRSTVTYSTTNCSNLATPTLTTSTEYVGVLPFPESNLGAPPYFGKAEITLDGTTIYTSEEGVQNLDTEGAKFLIINNILDKLNESNLDYQVYWETYKNTYNKGSFIFVSNNATYSGVPLNMNIFQSDGITVDNGTLSTINPVTFSVYSTTYLESIVNSVDERVPNRLTESEKLYNILQTPFFKSKKREPISSTHNGFLRVYQGKSFIIKGLSIDYIRKPKQISLSLNQTSELSESAHDKLVDLCVELMKIDIQDRSSDINTRDTELRD